MNLDLGVVRFIGTLMKLIVLIHEGKKISENQLHQRYQRSIKYFL